jgi:hypothetical protein
MNNGYPVNRSNGWAGTSYSANYLVFGNTSTGSATVTIGGTTTTSNYALVSSYRINTIPDGGATTAFLAERVAGTAGNASAPQAGALWAMHSFWSGLQWAYTATFANTSDATNLPNRYMIPLCITKATQADQARASSFHPTTVNVLMGDSAVKAVKGAGATTGAPGITQTTWQGVIVPDDGNVPGRDWTGD